MTPLGIESAAFRLVAQYLNLMRHRLLQQFVVTHSIRQAQIFALLDGSFTNTPVKNLVPTKKNCFFLHFRKNTTRLNVGELKVGHFFLCLL